MKKVLTIICLAAMLLSMAACGEVEKTPEETQPTAVITETQAETVQETEAPTEFSQLNIQKYEGYEFRIFYITTDNFYLDFESDGDDGSILSSAVYNRNLKVEDAMGITITCTHDSTGVVQEAIKKQESSGDYSYDLFTNGRTVLPMSYGGYLYNLASIESLDLSKIYWDQSWTESMTFDGSLYALVGDISLYSQLFDSCICFNKKLFKDLSLTEPYQLVKDGKWTYEELSNLMKAYGGDANGDGTMKYTDDNFALSGWLTESGYGMFYGSGFQFAQRTGTGEYEISFDSARLQTIIESVVAFWTGENVYFNTSGSTSQHAFPFSVFSEGRALFLDTVLKKVADFLGDMEDDYGILPEPKLDAEQENYYSYVGYSIPLMLVGHSCPEPEKVGSIMQALCAASYDDVTPQILEIVTKTRNVRDYESSDMINIIIRNKIFDPVHWFDVSGYGSFSRTMITSGSTSVSAFTKTYDKAAQKQWKNIISSFEKLK